MIFDLNPATVLNEPASTEAIAALAAVRFGVPLPKDIVDLLRESDGAEGEWGGGVVWSADAIARINTTFRTEKTTTYANYGSFDDFLFFGDAGNGDQFAFVADGRVLRWDHETDDRQLFASDLAAYLRRRLTDPEWS